MKLNIDWKNKTGIYMIRCIPTGKVYIGKSKNLYNRLKSHTTSLNRELSKHENQYLINAWKKYGEDNFEYSIIEYCKYEKLSERELYYIELYNSCDSRKGFNLRKDTHLGMIPSKETRKKMSNSQKKRRSKMTQKELLSEKQRSSDMWKNRTDSENDKIMRKGAITRTKYQWLQYTKDNVLVKKWKCVRDILKKNPNYKRHNIYAVASGEKPSMYGYIWKKQILP